MSQVPLPPEPSTMETSAQSVALDAEQIARRASTGAVLFAARSVVVRGIGVLAYLVLARLLTPHEFGTLSIGLSLTFLGGFLADAGLGQAFIQRSETPAREELAAMAGLQLTVVMVVLLLP